MQKAKLSEQEQLLFSKYGKLPPKKNSLLSKTKERKYFDSGDYALAKAGKAPEASVGEVVPTSGNIPHSSPNVAPMTMSGTSPTSNILPTMSLTPSVSPNDRVGVSMSPVKDSRLQRQISEQDGVDAPSVGHVTLSETGSLAGEEPVTYTGRSPHDEQTLVEATQAVRV